MAYPFPGFGTFIFQALERPLDGSDSRWQQRTNLSVSTPVGGTGSNVTTMAYPAATRSFNLLMTLDRIDALRALLGTKGAFVDWPEPGRQQVSRQAVLASVEPDNQLLRVRCTDGSAPYTWKARVSVELIAVGT